MKRRDETADLIHPTLQDGRDPGRAAVQLRVFPGGAALRLVRAVEAPPAALLPVPRRCLQPH